MDAHGRPASAMVRALLLGIDAGILTPTRIHQQHFPKDTPCNRPRAQEASSPSRCFARTGKDCASTGMSALRYAKPHKLKPPSEQSASAKPGFYCVVCDTTQRSRRERLRDVYSRRTVIPVATSPQRAFPDSHPGRSLRLGCCPSNIR